MDRAEYVERYKQIEAEAEKAILKLRNEWVSDTKIANIDDVVTCPDYSIKVSRVCIRTFAHDPSEPPMPVYHGTMLKKDCKPRKDGKTAVISQVFITHVNGKPVTQSGG